MSRPPETSTVDATGCFLLFTSVGVCVAFGIATLGSYFPNEVRIAFLVSLVVTVASTVLSCIIAVIKGAKP